MKQLYNQKSSNRLTALTLTLSLTLGLMLLSCSSGVPSNTEEDTLSSLTLTYTVLQRSGDQVIASPVWTTASGTSTTVSATYTLSPSSLSYGLALNQATGVISGNHFALTTAISKINRYTITATGTGSDYGSRTAEFLDGLVLEEIARSSSGTAINNADGLRSISNNKDGTYYLTGHIDLSDGSWEPLFNITDPFTGTLQGNGYAIYNLTIKGETTNEDEGNYQGLFASLSNATVEHLAIGVSNITANAVVGALAGTAEGGRNTILSNIVVAPMNASSKIEANGSVVPPSILTASGAHVGGLVGWTMNDSIEGSFLTLRGYNLGIPVESSSSFVGGVVGTTLYQTTVSGYSLADITGHHSVGGMIGSAALMGAGNISGYATGKVTGTGDLVGGFAGRRGSGTFTGYASGEVSGVNNVGGLAGDASSDDLKGYATGKVTGTGDYVGGLVGSSGGVLNIKGFATGDVSGVNNVGGLIGNIGLVGDAYDYENTIAIGFATGNVNGSGDKVGGLVGRNHDAIVYGYAVGRVTRGTGNNVGGLVGGYSGFRTSDSRQVVKGYWDVAASGQTNSADNDQSTTVRVSATKNIVYSNGYTDSGNTNATIFIITEFTNNFDTANGASKTWPKLKDFDLPDFARPQPRVSDTDGDDTIEVVWE